MSTIELNSEVIEYRTATDMARTFRITTDRMRELIVEFGQLGDELKRAFRESYVMDVELTLDGQKYSPTAESAEAIVQELKRRAWAALIHKLEIEKLMSSKRRDELNRMLHSRGTGPELPEISEETITSVLQGYVHSASEFLQEAIAEEFEFWHPAHAYRHDRKYKRNKSDRVAAKIIRGWMVERGFGSCWRPQYRNESHIQALDQIFHLLDGKGVVKEYRGPLASAIMACGPNGLGETEYFRFRCCKNGNLHIEFTRLELLAEFNRLAGHASLLGEGK